MIFGRRNTRSLSATAAFLWLATASFSSSTLSVAAEDDTHAVTCGSFIKVTHVETGYDLNSEQKTLGGGSGQQIVTFVKHTSTHNTLWWIRPAQGEHTSVENEIEYTDKDTCQLAEPVACGSTVRFTHADTLKNLHSHGYKSPLSSQQEVSCYGTGDGNGDGGDNWIIECDGKHWTGSEEFRMVHVDTGKYLGAAPAAAFNVETCGNNCPIMGHYEAFCRTAKDKFSLMKVQQGIHLSI